MSAFTLKWPNDWQGLSGFVSTPAPHLAPRVYGNCSPRALPDTFLCRLASSPPVPVRFRRVAHLPSVWRKSILLGCFWGVSEVLLKLRANGVSVVPLTGVYPDSMHVHLGIANSVA